MSHWWLQKCKDIDIVNSRFAYLYGCACLKECCFSFRASKVRKELSIEMDKLFETRYQKRKVYTGGREVDNQPSQRCRKQVSLLIADLIHMVSFKLKTKSYEFESNYIAFKKFLYLLALFSKEFVLYFCFRMLLFYLFLFIIIR